MGDRIIYISLALLALLGCLSFWANPQYEKGVWIALVAISNCLSAALGAKFGLATPNTTNETTKGADDGRRS